jgi:hypothetical protein
LQDRMHESVIQIQALERENVQLKQDKQELSAELDAVIVEKRHLQTVLETSLEEKKRLTDRINNFTIIEHDLNMEIDRLTRLSGEQKRKIAELECSLVSEKVEQKTRMIEESQALQRAPSVQNNGSRLKNRSFEDQTSPQRTISVQKTGGRIINRIQSPNASPSRAKNKPKKKTSSKRPSKSESPTILPQPSLQVPANTPQDTAAGSARCCNCHCESCSSSKHLKELLDKELEYREQQVSGV